jgi:hypothetical protein
MWYKVSRQTGTRLCDFMPLWGLWVDNVTLRQLIKTDLLVVFDELVKEDKFKIEG